MWPLTCAVHKRTLASLAMNETQKPNEHRHNHRKDSLKESLQPLVEAIKEISPKKRKQNRLHFYIDGFYALLKVVGILLFFAIAADTGIQIWKQCHTQTILIEPFAVSPDLEKFGYSSKVIAVLLVDKCEFIINSTKSGVDLGTFSRAENESYLDIDVPETHLSLKSLANYVTERFGHHPTRITGEFIGPTNQLTLTMRIEPAVFRISNMEGTLGGLDQLLDRAATNILKQTHPYDLACYFYDQGETNEALGMIQQCINNKNENDVAWANILWGIMFLDQSQYQIAVEKFKQATNYKSTKYTALCNLAAVAQTMGSNNEAMTYVNKALKCEPKGGHAYAVLGIIKYSLNDYAGSSNAFSKGIYLDPKSSLPYANRAKYEFDRGDYIASIADDNKAIELTPTFAELFFNSPFKKSFR